MVREKPGTSPCCMEAGCYQGCVKVVACDSQRLADLYKQAQLNGDMQAAKRD